VNIAIQGANVPGAGGSISIPPSKRSTRISQRGVLGFVKNAVKCTRLFICYSLQRLSCGTNSPAAIASNAINVKKSVNLKPLALTKSISLLNKSIKCGAAIASLKADLSANAHATASVGVAASGTLIPPKVRPFSPRILVVVWLLIEVQLTDFGIITGLTASVDGTLDLTADVAVRSGCTQARWAMSDLSLEGLD
jgi:hypothetical protein